MDPFEALYLLNKLHHKELLRIAEQERMVRSMRRKQTARWKYVQPLMAWVQAHLPGQTNHTPGRASLSNPCCTATKS